MDIREILEHLPHRYPMLLVDRVLECEPGKRLLAIKNVTINEPFFAGHFPHYPVMPGVMVIEALAQAAAILSFRTLGTKPDDQSVYYFAGIDEARFKRPVVPGDPRPVEILRSGARRRRARRRSEDPVHAALDMIHPSAVIHSGAKLAPGVSVGPYSIVGEHVEIGEGTSIGAHVVIEGRTRIGAGNRIFGFSSLGGPPQDKKYGGEPTALEIGERNTIREYCSFNCGTAQDAGVTRIGSDNWIMAYVNIAQDCQVGDHTVFANVATLAGHVRVGDYAVLGGFTGAHQFVSIGAHSITGVATVLLQDLPPYVMAAGNTATPFGINNEGLKRRGFNAEKIAAIKRAYKTLYRSGLALKEARRKIASQAAKLPELQVLVEFLERSQRGIIR